MACWTVRVERRYLLLIEGYPFRIIVQEESNLSWKEISDIYNIKEYVISEREIYYKKIN